MSLTKVFVFVNRKNTASVWIPITRFCGYCMLHAETTGESSLCLSCLPRLQQLVVSGRMIQRQIARALWPSNSHDIWKSILMQFSAFLEEMLFLTKCVKQKYMPHLWDIRRKCGNIYQNRKSKIFYTGVWHKTFGGYFPFKLSLNGKSCVANFFTLDYYPGWTKFMYE